MRKAAKLQPFLFSTVPGMMTIILSGRLRHIYNNKTVLVLPYQFSYMRVYACIVFYFIVLCPAGARAEHKLLHPALVPRVTQLTSHIHNDRFGIILQTFRKLLDSSRYSGLNKYNYHYRELYEQDSINEQRILLTDALLAYFTDLKVGRDEKKIVSYNEFATRFHTQDQDSIVNNLNNIRTANDIYNLAAGYEPSDKNYLLLKYTLHQAIDEGNINAEQELQQSLNIYRWILHFKFRDFILVNIASTQLRYHSADSLVLDMKIVAGKPATKTPRFSAYLHQVIFYPYWHVPRSIAINELLPRCKKNPHVLNSMNIQVLNSNGTVVDPGSINWSKLSKKNFPYTLRQSTGCDNALGIIKFNLTSPFSVYLHDTNLKSVFASQKRYLSHGCIRIEKPIELAQILVPGKVDSNFLKSCSKGQKPITEAVKEPVPVFVVYMTADVVGMQVQYFPDIYNLRQ